MKYNYESCWNSGHDAGVPYKAPEQMDCYLKDSKFRLLGLIGSDTKSVKKWKIVKKQLCIFVEWNHWEYKIN